MQKLPWKTEKEFYDRYAKKIFTRYNFFHAGKVGNSDIEFLNYIIKRAKITKDSKVLDLGCGSGYVVGKLTEFGIKALGISNSEEVIKQAKKNFPNARFEVGNMETYQFEDFDRVLTLETLGHSNVEKTLKNIYKNIKKDGILYIKEPFLKEIETKEIKENRIYVENYFKYKFYKLIDILTLATNIGFKIIEVKKIFKINEDDFVNAMEIVDTNFKVPYPNISSVDTAEIILQK